MDLSLSALFTLPFIAFCVIVYLVTQLFRTIVEAIAKKLDNASHFILNLINKIKFLKHKFDIEAIDNFFVWAWRENILPAMPLIVGGVGAYLVKDYPYPDLFGQSAASRAVVGVIAGIACVALYPRVKFYLKKKDVPEEVTNVLDKIDNSKSE